MANNSCDDVMETSIQDSRKRPLDEEAETGINKRSNPGTGDNVQLKILVPTIAAGAVIGKGGEVIAQIQKDSGARVKMSKANDVYPGTSERVCLIVGSVDAVVTVVVFIMEKIKEKPESWSDGDRSKQSPDKCQLKVLVPNSTAGMIIGKQGSYITHIKETTGAYIQISQKSKDNSLPERCMTIAGDHDAMSAALQMIVKKISEDPQSGSCPNISYLDYSGPVASSIPTGSPYASSGSFSGNPNMSTPAASSQRGMGSSMSLNNLFGGNFPNYGFGRGMAPSALDGIKATLRSNGYNEQATEEISMAINTLASYGILSMGMGMMGLGNMSGGSSNQGRFGMSNAGNQSGNFHSDNSGGMFGPLGGFGDGSYQNTGMGRGQNSFNAGGNVSFSGDDSDITKQEMQVAENIVGVIIGPGGSDILKLQNSTGTTIQISKKGVYAPNTQNRIVTLSGTSSCIRNAIYMIQQRIQKEEMKRAAQDAANH